MVNIKMIKENAVGKLEAMYWDLNLDDKPIEIKNTLKKMETVLDEKIAYENKRMTEVLQDE